ncbi:MAG: HIT family protein [Candidatus Berkelbacteria bacterium]|nr:HIT family protein [Candidatus Berkelbacteria bacterium]
MTTCLFCKIVSGEIPTNKIFENDDIFAFLDINPVNPGHTLIVPKKHFVDMSDTPEEILCKMILAAKMIGGKIMDKLGADGYNLELNNKPAAGQIVEHVHLHIMPRYSDDNLKLWPGKNASKKELDKIAKKLLNK